MYALPTTTVSILRGTTTDQFGDTVNSDTVATGDFGVALSGLPCSLVEQTRTMRTGDSATPRVVHFTVGRIAAGTDIRETDRLLDETSGSKYIIEGIATIGNPVMQADIRLDLKRTT